VDLEKKFLDYIDYISTPQKTLNNNSICPFAKRYFTHVEFKITNFFVKDLEFYLNNYPKNKKLVVLLAKKTNKYSINKVESIVEKYYNKFKKNDLWLAFDHPLLNNYIGNVKTNNNFTPFLLIQPLQELIRFSNSLEKTDYYNFWSKKYYQEIVEKRRNL